MSNPSKFDAAIKVLNVPIVELEHEWEAAQPQGLKAKQDYDALIEQFESAIRVLEAAGKAPDLSPSNLHNKLESWAFPFRYRDKGGWKDADQKALEFFRALLESLPKKEGQ